MSKKVILGIDIGGTFTRVVVADLEGNILSYSKKDSSLPQKNYSAASNFQESIIEAINISAVNISDVVTLVAGIARYDTPEDILWVKKLINIPDLKCKKVTLNDAVIAHAGAFVLQPGLVAISGTGSIVYGLTENNISIRNYDFLNYAKSAARYLSYEAIHRIIAGQTDISDSEFVNKVLSYWNLNSLEQLVELASHGFMKDAIERDIKASNMCILITQAAKEGSKLAQLVCKKAMESLAVSIAIVGSKFTSEQINLALLGGVITDQLMVNYLKYELEKNINKKYKLTSPIFSPVIGAIILGYRNENIEISKEIIVNLKSTLYI